MPAISGRKILLRAASALLMTTSLSGVAVAQQAAGASKDAGVGDIIVTAQKREQALNSVPITITAASGETLRERGIATVADLPRLVPGFTVQESQFNSTSFTLRGVGFFNTDLATPPTVTVYVDEAPLPYPAMTKLAAFDLERVEVLKGPQGTLFGQNATAGLINFVAAKPTDRFQAGLDLGYGRFNRITLGGFVSGPLSDTISARLALQGQRGDAWQYSVSRPGDKMGRLRQFQGRATFDFHPGDRFTSRLTLTATHEGGQPQAAQYVGSAPSGGGGSPPAGFLSFPVVMKPRAADWTTVRADNGAPFPYRNDNTLYQISWRNDYDLSDAVTLTALTSYSRYKMAYAEDPDGTPFHVNELIDDKGTISSFFQEVRLAGKTDAFNWQLGANYVHDRVNDNPVAYFGDKDVCALFRGLTGGTGYCDKGGLYGRAKVNTYAVYGRVEYDITPDLSVEAGGRYNIDHRTFDNCALILTNFYANFWNIIRGGKMPLSKIGDCYILDSTLTGNQVPVVHRQLNDNSFSWRVGVNWKARPGMLLYANISKGYKAGIVPVVGAAQVAQLTPVPTESVLAYEAGIKATLLDRRVQFNAAGFYYDYKGKQLRGSLKDPLFGPLEALVSIPKSHAYGLEAQLVVTPVRGLTFDTAVTYVRTKIDRFFGYDAFGVERNLAGSGFPFSPKWQSVSNIDYKFPLNDAVQVFAGGTMTYNAKTFSGVGGKDAFNVAGGVNSGPGSLDIDAYTVFDVRAGVELDGGRYRIWGWGKNITNKYYWTSVLPYGNAISRYVGQPATYGISLSYRFR